MSYDAGPPSNDSVEQEIRILEERIAVMRKALAASTTKVIPIEACYRLAVLRTSLRTLSSLRSSQRRP